MQRGLGLMNFRAYVAEFVGTFALVWVGILAINHFGSQDGGLLGVALAHGLAIGLLATATAAVSGGHLNPAVTLAMLMAKRIKAIDAFGYWVVQFAAGFVAAILVTGTLGGEAVLAGTPMVSEALRPSNIEDGQVVYGALALEAIATFFLVFVIFGTAVDNRAPKMGGLYIGGAVTMGILAIGPLTGAAMNPARWLGPAMNGNIVAAESMSLGNLFMVYGLGPITGALVAALVYQYVLMDRKQVVEDLAS